MRVFKPLDYWTWAAQEDVVSNDNYPDPADPEWRIESALGGDLMRSLKHGQPWLLMEQAPTNVNWRERNATKAPGVMRLGSSQALARGADGILFFQWRASQAGAEKFHSGMLPHGGTDSRGWREVVALGRELAQLRPLVGSRVEAHAAILFDWENWWALEFPGKLVNDLSLLGRVKALYSEFYRRNLTLDLAHPAADLGRYRLVVAPHLYLVSDRAAQNLVEFVRGGGTLWMTFSSGLADSNDHIRLGGYPAPFRELLGLWVEEMAIYSPGRTNVIATTDGRTFTTDLWNDVIHLRGAQALAHYRQDFIAGTPAVTRHEFGRGLAYYQGTSLAADGLGWLVERVSAEAGIAPALAAPPGVEVTRRTGQAHSFLIVLNHLETPVSVPLSRPGRDLLSGRHLDTLLELPGRGVAVIQSLL
jgi:beta-galactosidase